MKTLAEIADAIGGSLDGPADLKLSGISSIAAAGENELAFLASAKYSNQLPSSKAGAFIIPGDLAAIGRPAIRVQKPHLAFAKALNLFYAKPYASLGVSPDAKIAEDAKLGGDVTVYPFVYIGPGAVIGERVSLFPFVHVGAGSTIGDDTVVFANVSIYPNVHVGKRCILHSGVVLGADGFGFAQDEGKHQKIPQIGKVIIEDDVELGANTCVDKATLDATVIGCGTKVDNLVQVAHNVRVGKNSILVSQAGIAGSGKIGNNVILAAQAGVSDHVAIGDNSIVIAQAGVVRDVPENSMVSLTPAIPHNVARRAAMVIPRLPEMLRELQELKKRVEELEKCQDSTS